MLVQIFCLECKLGEDLSEMKGEDVVYENVENHTQARDYICPDCDNKVNVVLTKD